MGVKVLGRRDEKNELGVKVLRRRDEKNELGVKVLRRPDEKNELGVKVLGRRNPLEKWLGRRMGFKTEIHWRNGLGEGGGLRPKSIGEMAWEKEGV